MLYQIYKKRFVICTFLFSILLYNPYRYIGILFLLLCLLDLVLFLFLFFIFFAMLYREKKKVEIQRYNAQHIFHVGAQIYFTFVTYS